MTQPNFILIITDQQRADYLGCYGHPSLKTPNIDRIAKNGVRFERFYVATPVCMPNRASLMTGRMPSLHGVRHNGIGLSVNANTFVDVLRENGYRTALVGKSHLQNVTDVPPLTKRNEKPAGHKRIPEQLAEAERPPRDQEAYLNELPSNWIQGAGFGLTRPYYGFDHVRLCTRHGDRVGGHYYHWLADRHPAPHKLTGPKNALPHEAICPQAWRTAVPEELYPTSYIAEESIAYLRNTAAAQLRAPFFMQVSFPDPHHPFTPPGRYWDMYHAEDMKLPPSFIKADPERQPHVAWLQNELAKGKTDRSSPHGCAVTEREAREAMALTCGMIAMIDAAVGKILDELEALGLEKNTVVMYTSDHGDFLGDHQLLLKGPMHFQGTIRVPFIWSDPASGSRGKTTQSAGSTLDIAQTILDRAALEPYNGIQGRSLLPVISDPEKPDALPPRDLLIEDEGQRAYYGFEQPVRCRTLLADRWRFTVYHGNAWGEMYDLVNDPHELDNLWFDQGRAPLKAELSLRLVHAQMAAAERSPLPTAQG